MTAAFELDFPRAYGGTVCSGRIKSAPSDFFVQEILEVSEDQGGEHIYLWLRKEGQNTEYVAKQIAKYAKVRAMDVGFSGLKDRWAVTEQWFSIYIGNKEDPDWSQFDLDGVEILKITRSSKKLRRGQHGANFFRLVVRDIGASGSAQEALESRLIEIQSSGFPNYFGLQRFGFDGSNLSRAEKYFLGEIKASKSQRSYYLSAARSYLFNLMLAEAIAKSEWLAPGASGALYGDEVEHLAGLSSSEQAICDRYPTMIAGLKKNRLVMDRREFCVLPRNMEWKIEADVLEISFELPTGVFATSLLAELLSVEDASSLRSQS